MVGAPSPSPAGRILIVPESPSRNQVTENAGLERTLTGVSPIQVFDMTNVRTDLGIELASPSPWFTLTPV